MHQIIILFIYFLYSYCCLFVLSKSTHPRVLVLDIDGTLYENECQIESQIQLYANEFSKSFNISNHESDEFYHKLGSTIRGIAEKYHCKEFFRDYYNEVYPTLNIIQLGMYRTKNPMKRKTGYQFNSILMSKAHKGLRKLKSVPIVLASNSPVYHVKRVLSRLGLADLPVAAYLTPERRGGITKTEKQFWDPLFESFPKDIYKSTLIDDNSLNIANAKHLGMNGYHLTSKYKFFDALIDFLINEEPSSFQFDSVKYLEAKNTIDHQSFNQGVQEQVKQKLFHRMNLATNHSNNSTALGSKNITPIRIVDIGAGLLNMLRLELSEWLTHFSKQLESTSNGKKTILSGFSLHYIAFETNRELYPTIFRLLRDLDFKLSLNETSLQHLSDINLIPFKNQLTAVNVQSSNVASNFRFTGSMHGFPIVVDVTDADFMSNGAPIYLQNLTTTRLHRVPRESHSNHSNVESSKVTNDTLHAETKVPLKDNLLVNHQMNAIDLFICSGLADLYPPDELVFQLISLANELGGFVYLPITYTGTTFVGKKIRSSSTSRPSFGLNGLFSWVSSGLDGMMGSTPDRNTLPAQASAQLTQLIRNHSFLLHQPNITKLIMDRYNQHLIEFGHHLSCETLQQSFLHSGCKIITTATDDDKKDNHSDWIISNQNNPYMWNCMLHFIKLGTTFELFDNVECMEFMKQLRSEKEELFMVAENVDLLVELPVIEKYIHSKGPLDESTEKMYQTISKQRLMKHPRLHQNPSAIPQPDGKKYYFETMTSDEIRRDALDQGKGYGLGTNPASAETLQCLVNVDDIIYEHGHMNQIESIETNSNSCQPARKSQVNAKTMEEVGTPMRSFVEFVKPQTIRINNESIPSLRQGEVLIATRCSLISTGTELKIFNGDIVSNDGDDDEPLDLTISSMVNTSLTYPLRYGYSLVGDIVKVSPDQSSNASNLIGKRVFSFSPHATHVVANLSELLFIPDGVSCMDAVFLPSIETAVSLVMTSRVILGEKLAVFGQGLIGLLTSAVIKQFLPSNEVTIVDVNTKRLDQAKDFLSSPAADTTPSSLRVWNPKVLAKAKDGFDVCIEVSGNIQGLQNAIDSTRRGGRVVIGSWYSSTNSIPESSIKQTKGSAKGLVLSSSSSTKTLRLGTKFHRSNIRLITSQVSNIPGEFSDTWDKRRRFELTWNILQQIKPSRLFMDYNATMGHARNVIASMLSTDEVQYAYEQLNQGNITVALLIALTKPNP